ncbi:hypothetical protein DB31_6522 [Hyalangium minutum]|uniref:Uncharacterized protein n=1 Tax=Hyalangium minutum TaxID=394096 RepID=A0A085WPD4_9BACT|nr:hypothetical protein DB31_6522 [Hyalangium minutum]
MGAPLATGAMYPTGSAAATPGRKFCGVAGTRANLACTPSQPHRPSGSPGLGSDCA